MFVMDSRVESMRDAVRGTCVPHRARVSTDTEARPGPAAERRIAGTVGESAGERQLNAARQIFITVAAGFEG